LVEVRRLIAVHEKDAAAAGALQGFQDRPAAEVLDAILEEIESREMRVRGRTISGKCWK